MYIKNLDEFDMSNLKLKVIKLYMYFLACDENQSNNKGLISFKYIKYKHSGNVAAMASAIEDGLTTLYSDYFDNVDVSCRVDSYDGGLARLLVDISVTEDNVTTNLSKEINMGNGLPTDIIEYFKKYVD